MPRLTIEKLSEALDALAQVADEAAEDIRPVEEISGEIWVSVNGIADDLERLARDVRSDLLPTGGAA